MLPASGLNMLDCVSYMMSLGLCTIYPDYLRWFYHTRCMRTTELIRWYAEKALNVASWFCRTRQSEEQRWRSNQWDMSCWSCDVSYTVQINSKLPLSVKPRDIWRLVGLNNSSSVTLSQIGVAPVLVRPQTTKPIHKNVIRWYLGLKPS